MKERKKMLFKYSVGDSDQIFEYEFDEEENFTLSDPICISDYEIIFEKIADEYYWNHDGSEDDWPLTFKLFDENNKFLASAKTILASDPVFVSFIKESKTNENI